MRKIWKSLSRNTAPLFGIILIASGGCELAIPDETTPDSEIGRPAEQFVTIAFRNLSTVNTVDVEFHAVTSVEVSLPEGLFTDENRVSESLGVAGTGLLIPGATDILEISCTENLVIGTAGGTFLDNETGELNGRGEPRWLDATSAGLCGAIVGFTFESSGDTFATKVEIRR